MEEENESCFLSHGRDMLDIEMSSDFKKAKKIMQDAASQLSEIGIAYVLKLCETSDYDDSMSLACKFSDMNIKTAGALLEYEQKRFLNSIQKIKDEKDI